MDNYIVATSFVDVIFKMKILEENEIDGSPVFTWEHVAAKWREENDR